MSDDLGSLSEREILILTYRDVKELKESKADHESRIRVVEKISAVAAGGMAIIGVVLGWFRVHAASQ